MEIYRIHSELSDRVSQRREGANRFYASLLTFVGISIGAVHRMDNMFLLLLAESVGLWLSVSWIRVIKSYRDLNAGKYKVLQELENNFQYRFFQREWEVLGMNKSKSEKRYLRLTHAETLSPWGFLVLFTVLVIVTLIRYK